MSKETDQFFTDLKKDFSDYVNTQLQLARLIVYEKSARAVALLALALALSFILFFALLFVFLAIGFLLGGLLNSLAAGFSLVALIYIVMFAGLLLFRKRISEKIEDSVIREFTKDDEYDDNEE